MMADWFLVVSQVSVISCGLVAGVFLTFSDLVMKSLAAPRPAGGIECMQVINRKVFKTVFMVLLLGMSALAPLLVGGAIYLVGVLLVTLIFNVPMNQRLDALDFSGSEVASYWKTYVPNWSFWNHVRTISSGASAICYLVAGVWLAKGTLVPPAVFGGG